MTRRPTEQERFRAEERARKAKQQALEGVAVRAEDEARVIARDANTAKLRALRLAKEAIDREEAAAVPPKATKHKP